MSILCIRSIKDRISRNSFYFDDQYKAYEKNRFAEQFLADPAVKQHLKMIIGSSGWINLSVYISKYSIIYLNII